MKNVVWPERTQKKLIKCFDMVAESNPEAARVLMNEVIEKVKLLERFPELGKLVDGFKRMLVVNKKIVIYYMQSRDHIIITQVKPTAMK